MKLLSLLLLYVLFAGCKSLPPGSYGRVVTGYTKDGPSGKAVIHIPFSTLGVGERGLVAPYAPLLIVSQ